MPIGTSRSDLILGVVGAGIMGRGIAQIAAEAGVTVLLADARTGAPDEAKQFCADRIQRKVAKGTLSQAAAEVAIEKLKPTNASPKVGYGALASCDIVIEAVIERMEVKVALIKDLEGVVRNDCIIATNTSSLSVTNIAAAARRPGRVAGFHFFNPVPLMKIVEVIEGVLTEPWVLDALVALASQMGHHPVRARDTPGFIVNHAGRGYGPEALRIVSEGIADFFAVDRIMTEAAGFRMGPFELFDLTGLDVSFPAMESIYHQYYEEARYRPSVVAAQRYAAGLFGRKTAAGFYKYVDGEIDRPQEPPAPTLLPGTTTWISQRFPREARVLAEALAQTGARIETGEKPSFEAIIFLTPLGEDCTTAALAEGLDPARSIAVDCLFGLNGRRTLMRNPVTRAEIATAAHALLAAERHPVTVITDSPGFVAQRIAAMIVNIGAEIVQQRITQPQELDRAVELGLGYPRGPLKLGNYLGPARILAILQGMHTCYRDPRYRPSPWLKRRATLGLDLYESD